jgi:hypothetical protein
MMKRKIKIVILWNISYMRWCLSHLLNLLLRKLTNYLLEVIKKEDYSHNQLFTFNQSENFIQSTWNANQKSKMLSRQISGFKELGKYSPELINIDQWIMKKFENLWKSITKLKEKRWIFQWNSKIIIRFKWNNSFRK